MGPIEQAIMQKLGGAFPNAQINLHNGSAAHAGHHGAKEAVANHPNQAKVLETHFDLSVVSDLFEGKNRVGRQRMILSLLADEFAAGLHALSIKAKTYNEHQDID